MGVSRYRRVAVQLTPLLDLTLIVFFAQYIEVQQRAASSADVAESARASQAETVSQLATLEAEYSAALAEVQQMRQALEDKSAQANAASERAAAAETRLQQALARQRVIGELVVELFGVPPEDVESVLDPTRDPPIADSPEELARLRERFAQMADQNAGQMIHHLLSYEEIRKRCDLWEIFVDENGVADVKTDDETFRLRIIPNQFEARFFDRYKSLPQPKGLVIILLTYDERARLRYVDAVRQALPSLVERMRADSSGRARFEYADVGIRLQ
ncbi:MAG: hypothetical protein DWQ34_20195 [Planctomycetota bacterium]|nr:MAG: hypothetical protein DWQ34_20195 [Planctomycetota bacterium]REK29324.1 MAG: hypothetical protein DWQ41_04355 [Planctomycetota bacterium]REK35941.1 MAG: hypothetical protein DWQ45_10505 [Planctomycetota bacterium]